MIFALITFLLVAHVRLTNNFRGSDGQGGSGQSAPGTAVHALPAEQIIQQPAEGTRAPARSCRVRNWGKAPPGSGFIPRAAARCGCSVQGVGSTAAPQLRAGTPRGISHRYRFLSGALLFLSTCISCSGVVQGVNFAVETREGKSGKRMT